MLQGAIVSYEETGFLQHFAEGKNSILFSMRGCREIEEQDFENQAKILCSSRIKYKQECKSKRDSGTKQNKQEHDQINKSIY